MSLGFTAPGVGKQQPIGQTVIAVRVASFMMSSTSEPPAREAPQTRLRGVLVGAGSLGRSFLRQLREHPQCPVQLLAVLTAHHGRKADSGGLDPSLALNLVEAADLGDSAPADVKALLEELRPDVLVECVPQNIRSGEPALTFIRAALDMGIHVVTSNKSPIVLGYRDLRHRSAKTGATFRFEATVLDGLPVLNFVSMMQGPEVSRVRGVLNGTSSVVLESVQLGSTRSRGLARAQAQGIAEADSVLDLDGWDAAAKLALLANVWMGGALRVVDVERAGAQSVEDSVIREAAKEGGHYRLVGDLQKLPDGSIQAKVGPQVLEPGDPLYPLRGAAGGLTIETNEGQSFTLLQQSYGTEDAALGLIHDCLAILRSQNQAP